MSSFAENFATVSAMLAAPAAPAALPMYKGKTADEWRVVAAASRKRSADSFERSDTDGFLSQWAGDMSASEADLKADIAEANGMIDVEALFLADGRIASTHYGNGDFGPYWRLNDTAALVYGKRFFNPSQAGKSATRRRNNAKKGFTIGTIRVAAYVTLSGGGKGLSGALSVRPVALPDVDALKSGDFVVVATDDDPRDY